MEPPATGYCGMARNRNGFRNGLVKFRDALGVKQWFRCILQFRKSLVWFLETRMECWEKLILCTWLVFHVHSLDLLLVAMTPIVCELRGICCLMWFLFFNSVKTGVSCAGCACNLQFSVRADHKDSLLNPCTWGCKWLILEWEGAKKWREPWEMLADWGN